MKTKTAEAHDSRNTANERRREELKDPVSGYASADILSSEPFDGSDQVGREAPLKDPRSGYAGAEAVPTDQAANEAGVDQVTYRRDEGSYVRL